MNWVNENNEYYNGHSIIYNGSLIINPTEEILMLAGYLQILNEFNEDTLKIAKYSKISELEEYDLSKAVNEFMLGDESMWLDAPTRLLLRTSIESYLALGAENVTKWFNGKLFTFPTNIWILMLNELEVYAAEALNVTEAHKAHIMSLSTVDEITIYDFTIGYPQKLNFSTEWMRSRL